jgi:predicted AAA+ superfamily ATPase
VVTADESHRNDLLVSYALVHLEEEMRREAMVRDWPAFVRFLRLAATESGQIVNYSRISRQAGITVPTVKSHYQLLEDMFIGFRVPGFSGSSRRSLLATDRFFFFDLGIRHAAADLEPSPAAVAMDPGPLFEQWVGIEIWKRLQYLGTGTLSYLRTKDGAEVDFVIERGRALTPVEVKWTERPSLADARHLRGFLDEHPRTAARGFIVCRCHTPLALDDRITAIPWWCV